MAIQKALLGQESKRMTVGEVMAKSRDRRARLFRVQMSTGRLDDWDVPGEERGRPLTRTASAGGRSLERGGPSRLGMAYPAREVVDVKVNVNAQQRVDSPSGLMNSGHNASSRAKTAPPVRPQGRSTTTTPTPATAPAPGGDSRLGVPRGYPGAGDRSPSPNPRSGPARREPTPTPQPKLSVVQLELQDSAKAASPQPPPPPTPVQRSQPSPASAGVHSQSPSNSRAVFPVSSKSLASHGKVRPYSVTFGKERRKPSANDVAEQECSVHIKHIHTLRDSAAVVRRWKELDRDREEKLNKWRMRMSFAATRRGNLGKMLSKV